MSFIGDGALQNPTDKGGGTLTQVKSIIHSINQSVKRAINKGRHAGSNE